MANYRQYQPRHSRSTGGGWGRWALIVVVMVIVVLLGKRIFGGKKTTTDSKNLNTGITLLTDNANLSSPANTNAAVSAPASSNASWSGFSTKKCPSAISSFGTKKRAVLTIALSAANDQVPAMLDILKQAGARADFFVSGTFASKNPAVVKSVSDAGYAVYSQSYDGTDLTTLSEADAASAVTKAETAIMAATGINPKPIFRPPGGSYTSQTITLLNQQGYCAILWTVDAYDWQNGMTAAQAKDRVMTAVNKTSGGSIIAFHAGYDIAAESVKEVVADLKSQGIEITTLAALLNT